MWQMMESERALIITIQNQLEIMVAAVLVQTCSEISFHATISHADKPYCILRSVCFAFAALMIAFAKLTTLLCLRYHNLSRSIHVVSQLQHN